jgi:putative transcriptional regulator
MTVLIPSCERVTTLLTAYEEGALGPFDWLGLKLHLILCPPCQTFLESFERTPALLRRALDHEPQPLAEPAPAEHALAAALATLREGRVPRGPQHHPEPEAWDVAPGGDSLLSLLLRVHLGHCEACRVAQGPDWAPIVLDPEAPPESLSSVLPSDAPWKWHRWGLGGAQLAQVGRTPAGGTLLYLAKLPGGRQAPSHEHQGLECSVILSGRLQDGPAHLSPGDWISHGAGQWHSPVADPGEACWSLVHLDKPVRFLGWRRIFNLGSPAQSS